MTQPVAVNRDEFQVVDLVMVKVVWDATLGSPPELMSYNGAIVGIPPSYLPLPARGTLFGVRGYSRSVGDGTYEWVLQGDVDPVDSFVDSLTGRPNGWEDQSARLTVKTMIQALFSAGIPRDTIVTQFPLLVQSVAAEIFAEQQADQQPPEG
jgi:hypothetical protein